ncbi:MAG: TIGR00282 family metallophosphoesterase [Clostridiales bacterium]|nr:TIGR00282 family metallophosphoesterase [Clostridiales bacterium]
MIIFVIGDVVGSVGCEFLRSKLPVFKKLKAVDVCIVNGENSADGNGITPQSAEYLLDSGADLITSGNHVYRRREVYEYLDTAVPVIRPYNYPAGNPGRGVYIIDKGRFRLGVVNLSGTMFMEALGNPFDAADAALAQLGDCCATVVDFHAEATAEKRALGFYLNGRVSAGYWTHTHVLTADEQILPKGTGYITDIGMTGPVQSVLGVKSEITIEKFRTAMPTRFDTADGECMLNGCLFEIDNKSGKTVSVERIDLR